MSLELNVNFASPDAFIVQFESDSSDTFTFTNPITDEDRLDIRWYLETYAASYTTELDDERASRIEGKLREWGEKLFEAVFQERSAQRLFNYFQDDERISRVLTISASLPEILSLPWELLCDPEGTFLLHETPRISVLRKFKKAGGARKAFRFSPKETLRLLFVVSRPKGVSFIDPRSDPMAVLDAIDEQAQGRVLVEFLRPATLKNLVDRLEDETLPAVDIIHFDGHGAFDPDGTLEKEAARTILPSFIAETRKGEKANIGYLLFENEDNEKAFVPADMLGDVLHRKKVGLIVLSACESARVGGKDAMGSVAARLTHAGIPAVIAMTHSVLVKTTRRLFSEFYQHLLRGRGIGLALDNARRDLYMNPERGERWRGYQVVNLTLQDWFLPTLYQSGRDQPMLKKSKVETQLPAKWGNLPQFQEAGFFGRKRELWRIERAFVGGTRRITLYGFGGQGKTYLAMEAARWLHRTGMFQWVCFVEFAEYQGVDAQGFAVSTLGTILDQNLPDVDAATKALIDTRTLVILDNLESLAEAVRQEFLEVARRWSEAGESRVLLTTRQPDFGHPAFPVSNSLQHICMIIKGLDEDDAVEYFQALIKLPPTPKFVPPKRWSLVNLFRQVGFHPLSIGLLAQQLKFRRLAELGQRLEALLAETPDDAPDRALMASLNLSLERLDQKAQQWLLLLGVFHGGAMEDVLLAVTGLGLAYKSLEIEKARKLREVLQSGDRMEILRATAEAKLPEGIELTAAMVEEIHQLALKNDKKLKEMLTELAEGVEDTTWPTLRQVLETVGLIHIEPISGAHVPYLKFHPTLAPALWPRLSSDTQERLRVRHRQCYYQLSEWLYTKDFQQPDLARAIARRELPNLLDAVYAALDTEEEKAVDFVYIITNFLRFFGLLRDYEELIPCVQTDAKMGSSDWYLSRLNLGEHLFETGRYEKANILFQEILNVLGEMPSFMRCSTLLRIGMCFHALARPEKAAEYFRQGLAVAEQLESSLEEKRLIAALHLELADSLAEMGDYNDARKAYEKSHAAYKEIKDPRQVAVANSQLGALALKEGNLNEALQRYNEAKDIFKNLDEPATLANCWHQIGVAYRLVKQWELAEKALRESARIDEKIGKLAGAANTWGQLAIVIELSGKPDEAEAWHLKSIKGAKSAGDIPLLSRGLTNLALHLQNQDHRLQEARQVAEEALLIKKNMEPGAAKIWKTYNVLAKIADKQKHPDQAREYRRNAMNARMAFPGTQHTILQHRELIAAAVAAAKGDAAAKQIVKKHQKDMRQGDEAWCNLADTLDRVLEGKHDLSLFEDLKLFQFIIIEKIINGIADPESLTHLLEDRLDEA